MPLTHTPSSSPFQSVLKPDIVTNKVKTGSCLTACHARWLGSRGCLASSSSCFLPPPCPACRALLQEAPLHHSTAHLSTDRPTHKLFHALAQVEFRLLGFIPGSVGLRGRFVSIPESEGGQDRKDTVKVRGAGAALLGAAPCLGHPCLGSPVAPAPAQCSARFSLGMQSDCHLLGALYLSACSVPRCQLIGHRRISAAGVQPSTARLPPSGCRCSLSPLCCRWARTSTSGVERGCGAPVNRLASSVRQATGQRCPSLSASPFFAHTPKHTPVTITPLQDRPLLQRGAQDNICGRASAAGQGQPRITLCVHTGRRSRCSR